MLTSNYVKALVVVGTSILSANAISADICYCPKKPKGNECNNQCANNPGGVVYTQKNPSGTPGVAPLNQQQKVEINSKDKGLDSDIPSPSKLGK